MHRVRGVVPAVVDWMVHTIAANAVEAYRRAARRTSTRGDDDDDDEIDDNDDDELYHGFDPTAASTPRTLRTNSTTTAEQESQAREIGRLGSTQGGLYLVVHADDIHLKHQVVEAFRYFWAMFLSDLVLNRLADALQLHRQLILCGGRPPTSFPSSDARPPSCGGTATPASATIGQAVLEKAARWQRHGMFCSILTHQELLLEQRAVVALQWLSAMARSCDPLCQTVAESILPNRHLVPLLRADFKMSSRATKAWYSLLLTLLAVPAFKSHLAAAYCDTYRDVTAKYAAGKYRVCALAPIFSC